MKLYLEGSRIRMLPPHDNSYFLSVDACIVGRKYVEYVIYDLELVILVVIPDTLYTITRIIIQHFLTLIEMKRRHSFSRIQ